MVVPLGAMRDRITVQRQTTVADSYGGRSKTWAAVYTNIAAKVQAVRGAETEQAGRRLTTETYIVTINRGYTITSADRIIWGTKTLNISTVQNRDGRDRRLTIECEVGLGA